MATNEKRRQKKLERKKQERKQRHHSLAKAKSRGLADQMADAARFPLLHTRYMERIFDRGMGQALISRELPDGQVAAGLFLLDTYCMGVKNAFGVVVPRGEYLERFVDSEPAQEFVDAPPEEVRQLIEQTAAFGSYCGFAPHRDYRRVRPVLGEIDPRGCEKHFEFGVEGVPHFVPGPHDSPARIRQVLAELHDRFGPDGFRYTLVEELPGDGAFSD